jgi:hypothetical protein
LGEHEQACGLDEDTLTRRRRVLGEDHPNTLLTAYNLAIRLRELGKDEQARALTEDTLTRRRRVLGAVTSSTGRSFAAVVKAVDIPSGSISSLGGQGIRLYLLTQHGDPRVAHKVRDLYEKAPGVAV